jgi:hypothetical protein
MEIIHVDDFESHELAAGGAEDPSSGIDSFQVA